MELESRGARIDVLLDSFLRKSSLGERDRSFVSELVYGVVRWKRSLDTIIAKASSTPLGKINPAVLTLLRMGVYQAAVMKTPPHAAVNETVALAKTDGRSRHLGGFVNGVLRGAVRLIGAMAAEPVWKIVEALCEPGLPVCERLGRMYSFPGWMVERWVKTFGVERAEAALRGSDARAPVFFRMNGLKITADEFEARFGGWGIEAERLAIARSAWRLVNGKLTPDSEPVAAGYAQPQDLSSMVAAGLLGSGPGDLVADICCGRGIKSGCFADQMENRGAILCLDSSWRRLVELVANMRRAGVEICRPILADAGARWPFSRTFGKIFVDAPCSGSGVLRRHPEGKWNKGPELIGQMAETQGKIIGRAAESLAPGGMMVYSVCSIEPEEGIDVVERLLSSRNDIRRVDVRSLFPGLDGCVNEAGDFFVLPGFRGMDGFYAAALAREP